MRQLLPVISLGSILIFRISTFIYTINCVNLLTPEEFVNFDFVLIVSGVFSILGTLNINNGLNVEISENRDRFIFYEKKISTLVFILVLVLSPLIIFLITSELETKNYIFFTIMLCVFQSLYFYYQNINRFTFRYNRITATHIMMSVFLIVSMGYITTLEHALFVLLFSYASAVLIQTRLRKIKLDEDFKNLIKRCLVFSLKTIPMALSPVIILYLDRIIIVENLEEGIQSNHIIDLRFAIMYSSLISLATTFLLPIYYKMGEQAFKTKRKLLTILFTVLWIIGLYLVYLMVIVFKLVETGNLTNNFFIVGLAMLFVHLAAIYGSPVLDRAHGYLMYTYTASILLFALIAYCLLFVITILPVSIAHLMVGLSIFLAHFSYDSIKGKLR